MNEECVSLNKLLAYLPFVYFNAAEVTRATGISRAMMYALIRAGEFPEGDLIAAQSRRWKSTEIAEWLKTRAKNLATRQLAEALKVKAQRASDAKEKNRRVAEA
ncbi:MAG: AlpA family phage regulatory protein [Rhodocyclaceae bacterium]|jgi:predicted DNA-binding transcriptional regulator AlpA|nr:AlpA family phage regulatory protein [Rhodocyclaceae bacterium]